MEDLNTTVRSVASLLSTTAGVGSRTGSELVHLAELGSGLGAEGKGKGKTGSCGSPGAAIIKTQGEQGQGPGLG